MTPFRKYPSTTLGEFFDIFDDIFETAMIVNSPSSCTSRKCPVHNVIEDDKQFVIELVLPGIKKEDTSIEIDGNKLIIKAERKENKDLKYNRKETYFGKYQRNFILPDNADKENIDASFADGILTVTVPKILDDTKLGKKKVEIK